MNAESLLRARLISFDIFDTLIKRSVAKPSDLFDLMEGCSADVPHSFARLRRDAARCAAEKKGPRTALKDIYTALEEKLGKPCTHLMQLEMELELASCQPNPEGLRLYRQCIAARKDVVLISDMYLPSELLEQMLTKCGITGYRRLYVSCEMGAEKRDGSLFRLVLREWNLAPGRMLHIGDNLRRDIFQAARLGIRTHHIPNDEKALLAKNSHLPPSQQLEGRTLSALLRNAEAPLSGVAKLGSQTLGPILLGFSLWLADKLREEKITQVYFLSRDGYLLKQAFDLLDIPNVQTHYLYCSRRSYTVPLLWQHPEFDAVFQHITIPRRISLERFLRYVGLEADAYRSRAEAAGLSMDRIYENNSFYTSREVRAFYQTIQPDVLRNSRAEYAAFLAYIRQTGMAGDVALVDIGRHGTMQNALQQLIETAGLDIGLTGYYVGVARNAPLIVSGKIRAKGYLHHLEVGAAIETEMAKFVPVFESGFLARHGSVRCFAIRDGRAVPVLYPYEYDGPGQCTEERDILQEYQFGALETVRTAAPFCKKCGFRLTPELAFAPMARMGTAPTLEEANLWGDFRVSDMVTTFVARPGSAREIVCDIPGFYRNFMLSGWKIGFLRRLLKLPLPYNRLYLWMQRAFHRRVNRNRS